MRPSKRPRWITRTAPAAFVLIAASSGQAAETAVAAAPAGSQIQPQGSIVDPANLILFSVELDQLTLSEGFAAYGDPADPHLPVGELTRLVEMDVEVLTAEQRIVGRIGEARRPLIVDLKTGVARYDARPIPLAAGDVVVGENDIYIRTSVLERLLAIKFEVRAEALALILRPEQPLPIQSRQERIARLRNLQSSGSPGDAEAYKVGSPYRLFSLPAFDIQLASGYQTETPHVPLRYDVRAAADLAYGNFQGYIGSDEEGRPSSARVLLERRSLEGRLLGPLKARTVAIGDVFTPSLSLGPRSVGGRGFNLSTVPLDETNIFNRIDLRGELPLGYDVELYINDVLRSGQNTPARGRYEFLNVPLSPGINVVRVVTYGPRGERSEQTRVINVGGGTLRRGEATFELGVVQQQKDVIAVDQGEAGGVITEDRGEGGVRAVAAFNYGLTSTLTLSAGAALIPVRRESYRAIYDVGIRTSLLGFATQLDLAADDHGRSAAFLGLAGQIRGSSLVFKHAEFRRGFLDENGPGFDLTRPTRRRTEMSLDASLEVAQRLIPLSLRAARYEYDGGLVSYTGSLRGSSTIGPLLASGGFEYSRNEGPSSTNQTLAGYLSVSTYRDFAWALRASFDYAILPELKASTLALTADRDITETWALRLGIGQPFDQLDATNFTVASIHRLRFGDLAWTGEYNNRDKSYRLGAQLSFGLAYNGSDGGYQITRPGPGSGGSVIFQAFMDENGNGRLDPGEVPVPNVMLEGGERRAVTDAEGRAFVPGIGGGPTARLTVNLDKVENPMVTTPPLSLDLRPRAGSTLKVDFPMVPTNDLNVQLNLKRPDGTTVGLAAAKLVAINEKGKRFEASTEYDGSAIFSGLPIGTYRVELEPEQAQRLRMRLVDPINATLKNDGGFGVNAQGEVVFEARAQDQNG